MVSYTSFPIKMEYPVELIIVCSMVAKITNI